MSDTFHLILVAFLLEVLTNKKTVANIRHQQRCSRFNRSTDFGIPIDSFVTTILIFQTFRYGLPYPMMENFSSWMLKKKCKAETWKPRPIIYLEQIHMKEWAHLTANVVWDRPASPEKEISFGSFKTFGNLTIWNMKILQMFFESQMDTKDRDR